MANPTALYSYRGQAPAPLPHEIRLSDGKSRTDVSSFTDEEILDAGFTGPYEVPDYDQEFQRLFWNSETLSFAIEDISDEELWDRIRKERNRLLSESDWTMLSDTPGNINLREYEIYRQQLRDLPNLEENPKNIVFPQSPESFTNDDSIYQSRILWRVRDLEETIQRLVTEVFPQPVGISSTEV